MAGGWPGLRADCEELLRAFQEADSVRFEDFASLWRQRRFHTLFYGKIRALEQNKFTKDALALVWPYFLPPYTFQIRVGALYLLYGLYNVQLCQPKQKIRVALKDWPEVMNFQQELLNAQHYDTAYIFRKLRMDNAFHFTAMPKLLSFREKKALHNAAETEKGFKDPSDRVTALATDGVLEELENVHKHYQRMKCLISEDKSQPNRALNLIKDGFVVDLKNMILEHQQWHKDKLKGQASVSRSKEVTNDTEGSSQESEGPGRARTLASIKARSYSTVAQVSKSRRHRQVRLESSAVGPSHGVTKSPRRKKANARLQPVTKRDFLQNRETLPVIREEGAVGCLSMPVITEDEVEDGDNEETNGSSDEEMLPVIREEGAIGSLSLPVITEDEVEDGDDEETNGSSDEDLIPTKRKKIL